MFWKIHYASIKETICSFLNTHGGIIMIGIKEDKKTENIFLQYLIFHTKLLTIFVERLSTPMLRPEAMGIIIDKEIMFWNHGA